MCWKSQAVNQEKESTFTKKETKANDPSALNL